MFETYAPTLEHIPKVIHGDKSSALLDLGLHGIYAVAPDISWFVYAQHDDCELWIWDIASGLAIYGPLVGHNGAVRRIEFSKDGKNFCSLDAENRIIVWNATSYEVIGVPVQLSSEAVDVSLCGNKIVVLHEQASVCVWDFVSGSLEKEHRVSEFQVTLPGVYFTVRENTFDPGLRIVNTMTGEDITSKYGDGREMHNAIFSMDDTRVLIRTQDWMCGLFDIDSGNIIGETIIGCPWPFFAADG